jgi:iron complex transport system substrate-binding protein
MKIIINCTLRIRGNEQVKNVSLLLTLVLMLILGGCGATNTNQGSSTGAAPAAKDTMQPKEPVPTKDAKASSAIDRTITHEMGTVTLKKAPERVVYLFAGAVDIGVALGVKPVGAVESVDQKPWFKYLGESMKDVKSLGEESQPNIEAIIALKPDLIIATKVRHEKIYPQLSSIAPTIVTKDLADWKDNLKLAADALDKKDAAAKIMGDWSARVADFKKKMGDKLATTEVSIIRFEKDNSAKFYVTGFPGLIVKELGLSLPKAQRIEGLTGSGVNLTSKEHIPQLDGDYIFDITTQLPDQKNILQYQQEWTSHPLWKDLKGVKTGKYFKVDPITWNLGGGALAAKIILDDLFTHFGIK